MKGVILAGGSGKRLLPLTKNQNKHLLPIYNQQMICYPITTLVNAGITDIMIVCGKDHVGQFISLLGDGFDYGASIIYGVQRESTGIADALSIVEQYVGNDDVCVILGDNIIECDITPIINQFNDQLGESKCHVVCKPVGIDEAKNYGVLTDDGINITIVEKPINTISDLAVIGLYLYSCDVFNKICELEPSTRGELEITDLNNIFALNNQLEYSIIDGFWFDCGVCIDDMVNISSTMMSIKRGCDN